MNEAYIRKKVVSELENDHWICWWPAKVMFKENDIFGVFDLVCVRGEQLKFIQLTTSPNISARVKKILQFTQPNRISLPVEVWGYQKKKHQFKKVILYTRKIKI